MNTKHLVLKYLQNLSQKLCFSPKIYFFIFGIASTAWFLMRVIPKPSRASYPCVRAAAPVASAFVLYLLSLASSVIFFKRFAKYLKLGKIQLATLFLTLGLVTSVVSLLHNNSYVAASETPIEAANQPIGIAQGINPGRVVWVYNPDATNAACTNAYGDGYFMDTNTNQNEVDRMLEEAIKKLTGETNLTGAWDAVFKYHNQTRGKGSVSYTSNESIFIKINATSAWSENINSSFKRTDNSYYAISETSPQVVLAVLRQLVYTVGVPQEKIYVGDPMKHIYQDNYTKWHSEFPNVHYLDHSSTSLGREKVTKSTTPMIKYSDRGTILHEGSWSNSHDGDPITEDTLYSIFENMEYMINIPNLKAHERAGVSMFGKNHFGSQTRDDAKHLHGGLVKPTDSEDARNTYGLYRVQVDLMTHKDLGKKNLFYLMDALYCSDMSIVKPSKWQIAPFNNDWTSSLFLSQDPVAIESVGFDFLYAQYDGSDGKNNYPHLGAVDDYLHQLADSTQWPTGIIYDPENDGTSIGYSQGVHEHWNNATEKKYSRNLGTGYGIELMQDFMSAQTIPVTSVTLNAGNLLLVSGGTSVLSAIISPSNATNQTVNWSSSNTNVATVNATGTVTAIAAGNTIITATSVDGNKTASCCLQVYCTSKGTNTNYFYIKEAKIGNYDNVSGNNSGYAIFRDQLIDLVTDSSYSIKLCPGFVHYYYKVYWRVYIDLNRNGSFADTGELIYAPGASSYYCVSGNIVIPSSATPGKTMMRVSMKYLTGASSCETYTHGEVEDYEVNISSSAPIPVISVSMSPTSLSMTPGQTSTLTATISPANATDQTVSWSSGNTNVVNVDANGKVTAIGAGTTTITATTHDGSITANCAITVAVTTNLALNKTATSSSDEDEGLTANYATDGDYDSRWSSAFSDPQWIYVDLGAVYNVTRVKLFWEAAYATSYEIQVSSDASNWTNVYTTTTGDGATDDLSITAVNARYVRMYGTLRVTEYGYSLYEFEVYGDTVDTQAPSAPTGLNSPSQTQTSISLTWAASTDNIGVTGYDIYKDGVYATSTNSTSCTISGLITATAYTFTVIAKDAAGNYSAASSAITVSTLAIPVTGVTLSSSNLSLIVGSASTLTATVSPTNATNQSVRWTSDNTDIATVNSSGVVTAVSAGSATITVTTQDGGKTATCKISVTAQTSSGVIDDVSGTITCKKTSVALATISGTSYTNYTWSGPNSFSSTAKSPSVSTPGIYTLTVKDTVNKCTVTAITNVLQNTLKPYARASSNGTLSCGTKTVSLKVTTSSANAQVTWDGHTTGVNPVTMEWPGTYFVTTKDTINGCTKRDSVTVSQYITYNPTQFYNNTFSTYANGTTSDSNTNGWSLTTTGFTTTYVSNTTQKYFAVHSKRVTAQKLGSVGTWTSKVMSVSGKPNFQIGVKISTEGTFTSSDYVKLYYKLDGGSEILWDSRTGSLGTVDFRSPILNANTVQIVVRLYTTLKGTSVVSNHYIEQYQLYIQDCGYPLVVYSSASGAINCANPSVTLQANSSHAGATYKWSGPNSYTSTAQYPSVSVPGTYTVTASMPTTASSSVTSSTATGTVTVTQNVTTPGASVGVPDTISSQKKYITLSGSSPTSGVYFSWAGPDSFVSSQKNPVVTTTGAYTLTVINPVNGCSSSASLNVLQNTSKSAILLPNATNQTDNSITREQPALELYPNPACNLLFLKMSGINTIVSIKVLDIHGNIKIIPLEGNGFYLDVSGLGSGLYILIVETDKCIFKKKFIRE